MLVSRRNSLRNTLASACLHHLDPIRFAVHSCGQPRQLAKSIHPDALGALYSASIPIPSSGTRSWEIFRRAGAARMNFVITLDASVASLERPWPGQPDAAVGPYDDVAVHDDVEVSAHAAIQALYSLRRRLELLVNLPLRGMDRAAVRLAISDLGRMR